MQKKLFFSLLIILLVLVNVVYIGCDSLLTNTTTLSSSTLSNTTTTSSTNKHTTTTQTSTTICPKEPTDFENWANNAINWAMDNIGSYDWYDPVNNINYCLRFVANCYMQKKGQNAGWDTALIAANSLPRCNQEPEGWLKAPRGALIFFLGTSNNSAGHVGIYLGNGYMIQAYGHVRPPDEVSKVRELDDGLYIGPYYGWAYPPEKWRPSSVVDRYYTLSLDVQGEGWVNLNPNNDSYLEGTYVTLTANPADGWEFDRWSGDLTGSQNPATIIMNSDKSITAIFIQPQTDTYYTMSLDVQGEGYVDINPFDDSYIEGTQVTLTANPEDGWEFDRWSGDLSGSQNPVTITMNSDKSITAIFTQPQTDTYYTMSLDVQGEGYVNLNPNDDSYLEGTYVTLTANPADGWEFDRWSGDLSGSQNPVTITMNSDKNITAVFTQKETDITLTLYIHENSATGPVIVDAQVSGYDADGDYFNQATNSSGYVTITGTPGTWSFTVSKSGYDTNSWSQDITSTTTKHAYLIKQQTTTLRFDDLWPSEIITSDSTYVALLFASGSNFNNVDRITFSWSGPDSGSSTWNRGDGNWNAGVAVNDDTSMTLQPRVLYNKSSTQTLTWTWTVTLRDTTGATASRTFIVTYIPPAQPGGIVVGSSVRATANLNCRSNPSISSSIIKTMPSGSIGIVIGGPVSADGYIWWQIQWSDGTIGWSVQDYLEET
jgi:cell wall-associated NlpC family hydrolase/ribosomal protein L11